MSVLTNVFRRGGVFYFRASVPRALRPIVGLRDLWKSLHTVDPLIARNRGIRILGLTDQLWRDLEPAMSSDEIKLLIAAQTRAQLDSDANSRKELSPAQLQLNDEAQRAVFTGAVPTAWTGRLIFGANRRA